jgi:hypothetical protein
MEIVAASKHLPSGNRENAGSADLENWFEIAVGDTSIATFRF